MFNSTKLTLANTMMIGVIMTVCSNNWVSMWTGLEMSLLSFLPFMQNKNEMSAESMMKYFIMQSVASTMFLFSVICMLIGVSMLNEMILTTSMLIKLGASPFHNWVLMIIQSMNYFPILFLLTTLKIPPLSILFQVNSKLLAIPIIVGMIISSILCLNQSSVKKILSYSSIFNMSLMLISIDKLNILMSFFIIYSFMLTMFIYVMEKLKINFLNQIILNEFSIWIKINLWLNLISMGGFPLTLGFFNKLMIIQTLIIYKEMMLSTIMIMTSMLVMMFYTRLAFTSILNSYLFKKWNVNKTKPMYFLMSLNISLPTMILPLIGMN